nr:PREDICTED: uncharacterized protein LOC103974124 isoform X1 [Musa acuminata subsp. malaccensis]
MVWIPLFKYYESKSQFGSKSQTPTCFVIQQGKSRRETGALGFEERRRRVNKKAPTVAYRQRMKLSRKYQFFSLGSSAEKSEAGFYHHHHLLRGEPQELLTLVAVKEKHPILVFRRRPNLSRINPTVTTRVLCPFFIPLLTTRLAIAQLRLGNFLSQDQKIYPSLP